MFLETAHHDPIKVVILGTSSGPMFERLFNSRADAAELLVDLALKNKGVKVYSGKYLLQVQAIIGNSTRYCPSPFNAILQQHYCDDIEDIILKYFTVSFN